MAKEVEVIFIKEKKGIFNLGQKKRVKLGYARNYLLPQKYAVVSNKENETKILSIQKKADKRQAELKELALSTQTKLNKKEISFIVKSHDEGKLYGSISVNDIVTEINKKYKTEIDKYDLKAVQAIKEIGIYDITVHIHKDVAIQLVVNVEAEEEKNKKKPTKKDNKKEEKPKAEVNKKESKSITKDKETTVEIEEKSTEEK